MKQINCIAFSIALLAAPVNAQSDETTGLIVELREAIGKLEAYEARISVLETTSLSLPNGAVVAFDLPGGCPDNWTPFDAGQGRTIIGVGGKYELPYVGGIPRYQTGGAETHTLTRAQLPSHSHGFMGESVARGGWGGQATRTFAVGGSEAVSNYRLSGDVEATGGGEAHNNMPPFVALYFCKKE